MILPSDDAKQERAKNKTEESREVLPASTITEEETGPGEESGREDVRPATEEALSSVEPSDEAQAEVADEPALDGAKEVELGRPVPEVDEATKQEVFESGDDLLRIVEALIFASHDVVRLERLVHGIPRVSEEKIRAAVQILAERYREENRAYELVEIADGYRLMTRPEYFPYLARMKRKREIEKLSPAGLEALAIIAYRQPVTRADIEGIRGVQSDALVRTLLDRKLIRVTGRAEVIGRPLQYGTTTRFLDMFGLANLHDLPKPDELGHD